MARDNMLFGPAHCIGANGQQTVIVISSHEILNDLIEKRSSNYSSRPFMTRLNRATGGLYPPGMRYGPVWKACRAIQGHVLRPSLSIKYRPLIDMESLRVAHQLLTTNDFSRSFKFLANSISMTLGYGVTLQPGDNRIEGWDEVIRTKAPLMESVYRRTSFFPEYFPILRYLPGRWKWACDDIFRFRDNLYEEYFESVNTTKMWNWVKVAKDKRLGETLSLKAQAHAFGAIQEGSLSPVQVLRTDILAMLFHRDAMAKAQEELDRVVGDGRLPTFGDAINLPYVNAFMNESHRWRPFTPFIVPRSADEEDIYQGYRIPKHSTLLINYWAILRDESLFPDPWTFDPDRWIRNPNLPNLMFGLGLRVCPGQQLGNDIRFIMVARILWAYRVEYASRAGKRVDVDRIHMQESATGTAYNICPEFEVSFKPRDSGRKEIIEREWAAAEKDGCTIVSTTLGKQNYEYGEVF
ncbi:unnamed protein product [Penicillium glandicola]